MGQISLMVSTEPFNLPTNFVITSNPSHHKIIISFPWLHKLTACPSMYHRVLWCRTPQQANGIEGNSGQFRKIDIISISQLIQKIGLDEQVSEILLRKWQFNPDALLLIVEDYNPSDGDPDHLKPHLETADGEEHYEELPLLVYLLKPIRIGKMLGVIEKENLMECLRRNQDLFAQSFHNMPWTSPRSHAIKQHRSISQRCKQKKRLCSAQRANNIAKEVNHMLHTKFINKVTYLKWLADVVVVPKKNNKWREFIDFRYLNKVCPIKCIPLLKID